MRHDELLRRIWSNPKTFGGKPTVRDTRILVALVIGMMAAGETVESLLDEYPGLEPDDIRACLAYAYALVENTSIDAVQVVPA
jgi:uncharacterized protein (DUF433 family)